MRGGYALATALGLAIGCAGAPAFVCTDSEDCTDGSFTGICQDNGYCSFGDPGCPSGQRYGEHAPGELAETCVDAEGTSTGAESTEGGATTFTTLDATGLEQGTSAADASDGTTSGEGTSTGPSVDDTSGNSTPMTTDSSTSSDTSNCDFEGDPCNSCIYQSCCEELIACAADRVCTCVYECVGMMGMTEGQCIELCGTSLAREQLAECIVVSCEMICV